MPDYGGRGGFGGIGQGGGADAGAGSGFGMGSGLGPSSSGPGSAGRGGRGGGGRDRAGLRNELYPGILPGERPAEYRARMEQQRRQAAIDAERRAREAAARQQAEQQRIAQEQAAAAAAAAAARQAAAQQAAQQAAQEAAAAKAAEEARQKAEQERLAAIEEQRRKDAEAAAQQRQARAQALGTFVTTGPGSLNRPADPLPRYRGYTPMDYDVSRTGSLTDQYARMLNVPFFQPFIPQEDINLAPGATTADSIFGIESLMPTYTFDPATGLASDPFAVQQATPLRQGGRVQKDMGGFIGFMDEPLNIMHPTAKIDVVDDGISSILKKYKEIRSEL